MNTFAHLPPVLIQDLRVLQLDILRSEPPFKFGVPGLEIVHFDAENLGFFAEIVYSDAKTLVFFAEIVSSDTESLVFITEIAQLCVQTVCVGKELLGLGPSLCTFTRRQSIFRLAYARPREYNGVGCWIKYLEKVESREEETAYRFRKRCLC
ncbi:hypothetical protein MD484_g4321, partial [Candolleomyces efflorescens]